MCHSGRASALPVLFVPTPQLIMTPKYVVRRLPRHKQGSPFVWYIGRIKGRPRDFDLDQEYLQSIWTGKCAISGIDIQERKYNDKQTLTMASLDRIDSSRGYVKGNVQFIAFGVNLAKNKFSGEEVREFISILKAQS